MGRPGSLGAVLQPRGVQPYPHTSLVGGKAHSFWQYSRPLGPSFSATMRQEAPRGGRHWYLGREIRPWAPLALRSPRVLISPFPPAEGPQTFPLCLLGWETPAQDDAMLAAQLWQLPAQDLDTPQDSGEPPPWLWPGLAQKERTRTKRLQQGSGCRG